MKKLGEALKWFLYITTSVLFVATICYTLSGEETLSVVTLWYILLTGFLTTIITMFLSPSGEEGQVVFGIKIAVHYVSLCIVMVILGTLFGWLTFCPEGVFGMCVEVAIVYGITFLAYGVVDRKQAEAINQRLKEKYGEDE